MPTNGIQPINCAIDHAKAQQAPCLAEVKKGGGELHFLYGQLSTAVQVRLCSSSM